MTTLKLAGKVALITGSSAGIGAAIAIEMSRQGAQVTIHGRNTGKLNEIAKQCEQESPEKKKVCIVVGDVVKEDLRRELIAKTVQCFGKLDILVNNAGSTNMIQVDDVSLEGLDAMLDVHVRAPYQLTKLAIPELIKYNGAVINLSSVVSYRPITPGKCIEYSMAKAAQDQLTLWMARARELGDKGVRVNSINPGGIDTDIFTNLGLSESRLKKLTDIYSQIHALGRMGHPEEVATVAVFLASEDASFVTGLLMRVDGGFASMPAGPKLGKSKIFHSNNAPNLLQQICSFLYSSLFTKINN